MFQQLLFATRSNAWNIIQDRLADTPAAQVLMVVQRKAVGFIAQALQHLQRGRIPFQLQRRLSGMNIYQLEPFGQSGDGHLHQAQQGQLPARRGELGGAPIHEDKAGQGAAAIAQGAVATADDLGHHGGVIAAGHGLDAEAAVEIAVRHAVHGADHAGHGVGTRDIGDIIGLDDMRHGR